MTTERITGDGTDTPRQSRAASHLEDATMREWTDLLSRIRFGVIRLGKRKSVAGVAIKAVAARMADYGDSDGSRVRPGLARVAVDLELSYETVKLAMQVLTRFGLLRLVHAAARRGDANVYHLAIPADLLDRDDLEVWSPARYALEVERIRDSKRGHHRSVEVDPDGDQPRNLRGAQPAAGDDRNAEPVGCPTPHGAVDNSDLRGAEHPAAAPVVDEPAGCLGRPTSDLRGVQGATCGVLTTPPPTNDLDTSTTDQPLRDLRTAVTVSREASPDGEDQISSDVGEAIEPEAAGSSPAVPDRCAKHPGFPAGLRGDGRPACAACRAAEQIGHADPSRATWPKPVRPHVEDLHTPAQRQRLVDEAAARHRRWIGPLVLDDQDATPAAVVISLADRRAARPA